MTLIPYVEGQNFGNGHETFKVTFLAIHCNILVYLAMVVLVAIVLVMTKTGHGRRTNLVTELLAILYNERIDFQIDCIFCSFRIA